MAGDRRAATVLGVLFRTIFGSLLALLPTAALVIYAEWCFYFTGSSDYPETPNGFHFLFITIPALILFVSVSRLFSRWPALFANCIFVAFICWRTWRFTTERVPHGDIAFQWTVLFAIIFVVIASISYRWTFIRKKHS